MKKKNIVSLVITVALTCVVAAALVGCGGSNNYKIAVPSDTTNEARALLLLEEQGIIKLKDGVGLSATANDIVDNPYGVEIVEAEAASLPRTLSDVDFAVINGNYALSAGLDPDTALASEDATSDAAVQYANIIAVRADDAGSEKTQALVEVLQGQEVQEFIKEHYNGVVIPVDIPSLPVADGKESENNEIVIGASPAPHAEILAFAEPLLEAKGFTLKVIEYSDYIQPNVALVDGEIDANYFQHFPYLEDYNTENNTTIASAAKIHFEPLSLYPGKLASLDEIKK